MSRPDPLLPASAYKTYSIVAPLSTHHRPATCAEVDCPPYLNGWRVRVETLTPEDLHLVKNAGRKWVERRVAEGETWLVFEAGQPCFKASEHRTRLDRPELFIVRDGDHRGNPRRTPVRQHVRPGDWVEDFAEHQQGLADAHQEG
jgi:hypothetical protein